MTEPLTQAQDHDRRIGRLEGIAEQLTEQGRQTNARFDRMEQTLTEHGRRIDALRTEVTRRMDSQFRWLLGVQSGIVGLLISILLKLN